MAVVINGTTGVSGVDGSAGTPSYQGADSNTGIFFPAADTIAFTEGGAEAMRINSSANVGIGTDSPIGKLTVKTGTNENLNVSTLGSGDMRLAALNDAGSATVQLSIQGSPLYFRGAGGGINATIDSSGNLLIGKTSQSGSEGIALVRPANTATYIYMLKNTQLEMTMGAKSSTDTNFYVGTGSSAVGTYGVYLTNTGNSWNAVSDERQKNIIESIDNGLEKVSTLRAVIGSYKHDPKEIRRPFLIAQDVQAVLPEAVNIQDEETGTLGMSYTDTIPLLVAAIKELKAITDAQTTRIKALEAEVAALKGAN